MVLKLGLLLIASLITQNESGKMLAVFPLPFTMYQKFYRPFTLDFAKKGHEIVVITTDPIYTKENAPKNYKEIDIYNITHGYSQKIYEINTNPYEIINDMRQSFKIVNSLMEKVLLSEPVQKIMKEEKFDLLILHACVESTLLLSHIFKAPVIQVSSFAPTSYKMNALCVPWSLYVHPYKTNRTVVALSFWDKLLEIWNDYWLRRVFEEFDELDNKMAKRVFGPDVPTIKELRDKDYIEMIMLHPFWEIDRMVPPSVFYGVGIHELEEKLPLPLDVQEFLDSSKHGVIYISFGTNGKQSSLPREKLEVLNKGLSEVPYNILFKYDGDLMPGQTDNIKFCQLVPDLEVLRHQNIKAFVTQGGREPTLEAVNLGVPVIGIPIGTDPWYTPEIYEQLEIGVNLDINTLSKDDLKKAVNEVVKESYRRNIAEVRVALHAKLTDNIKEDTEKKASLLVGKGGLIPTIKVPWTRLLSAKIVLPILFYLVFIPVVCVIVIYYILVRYKKLKID